MKQILETKLFEYDQSSYLLDLVRNEKGMLYVEIMQTFHEPSEVVQTIKIHPSVLGNIINTLQHFDVKIPRQKIKDKIYLTEAEIEQIIQRYLKGLSLKELALQFDKSITLIEMVLRNKGISIVSQEMPKYKDWHKRRK
jgi:hypothetical protein